LWYTGFVTRRNPALWLGILGIALLFVLLRWNNVDAPLTRDEGEYAYAAQLLLSGGVPYESSFLQKPPMVAYCYAVAHVMAPGAFWSPRLLAAAFAALATLLLGYIAHREFGPGVALPAMGLMTPMILLPRIEQFIANTEMFMLLPLMATVAVYVRSRADGGNGAWLAAGALAGVTLCFKYTAFPLLAVIFVAWSWDVARARKSLGGRWLTALLGCVAAAALVLAPFLLRDGGKRLWECTVVFNRFYAASSEFGAAEVLERLGEFARSWWILFLIPIGLVVERRKRVWFWAALFLVGWITTAGSSYGHYYIPIMPFWALLAALGIRDVAAWVAVKLARPEAWVRRASTAVVLCLVCLPDVRWMIRSKEQFATDKLGGWGSFLESPFIAARTAQVTSPRDLVYVAGSEPQVLCYANRFSPTRFVTAYPLMIPTPLAAGYQAEAIADLKRDPPAAIVLVRTPTTWLRDADSPPEFVPFLSKLLAEDYDVVGGYLSDGSGSQWQEPMDRQDVSRCTMVLFKRKAR